MDFFKQARETATRSNEFPFCKCLLNVKIASVSGSMLRLRRAAARRMSILYCTALSKIRSVGRCWFVYIGSASVYKEQDLHMQILQCCV